MNHKSLRFYSALVLGLVLLAALPALVQAEGEEDYRSSVYAHGYIMTTQGYGTCRVTITYRNQHNPTLSVWQNGYGPLACKTVTKIYNGDQVPKDLISFKGPVYKWLADGYFELTIDGKSWSFDVTTNETLIAETKTTYYPSGDVEKNEMVQNNFTVNSFEAADGTVWSANSGEGYVKKFE